MLPTRKEAISSCAKRRRGLQRLVGLGIPVGKLAKVLQAVREDDDVLEVGTRWHLRAATYHLYDQVAVSDQLHFEKDGRGFIWEYANLSKLFRLFTSECPAYRELLAMLHKARPSSPDYPWSLIVYCDETVPGDPLRLDQKKKVMAVYVTILDLGEAILKHDCAWLPLACLRTHTLKKLAGKWGAALRLLLRRVLILEGNVRDGVYLPAVDNATVFFKLSNIVCDELGLQQVWGSTGCNGTIPSIDAKNVTGLGAKGLSLRDDYFVDIACTDVSVFEFNKMKTCGQRPMCWHGCQLPS